MSLHRVHWSEIPDAGASLTVTGDEAQHALRVKRLEVGDALFIHNGAGVTASAQISATRKSSRTGGWELDAIIRERTLHPRPAPRVEVWSATPKGPRLEEMIDGLSEVGAAGWAPLAAARSVVEPREGKLQRLERTAMESTKQCGRAWTLDILAGGTPRAAIEGLAAGSLVIADADGTPYTPDSTHELVRILVGPEGGFTPEELAMFRAVNARFCSFAPHVLRIETAAVVAAAIVIDAERRARGAGRSA